MSEYCVSEQTCNEDGSCTKNSHLCAEKKSKKAIQHFFFGLPMQLYAAACLAHRRIDDYQLVGGCTLVCDWGRLTACKKVKRMLCQCSSRDFFA